MNRLIVLFFSLIILVACVNQQQKNDKIIPYNVSTTGLKYLSLAEGSGESPVINQKVTVHFILTDESGKIIEDTYKFRKPITFRIGSDDIILKGLEEAVLMMKPGGKMKIIIPPELGFGDRAMQKIPANSNLIMEVELLSIQN